MCSQCQLCIKLRWNMESLHGWWRGRRSTSSISTENWEHTRPSWRFHFHAGTSVPPVPIHSSYFIFTVLCRAHFPCLYFHCMFLDLNTQPPNKTLFYFSLCSHTVKRNIPLRSEVSQIPELPRGGDGELDRGVSSRRVNCSWWPIFNFMVPDLCTTYIKLYWIFLIVSLI